MVVGRTRAAICHEAASARCVLARGGCPALGGGALGLHLAFGVVVHEAGVAGEVARRRRGGGDIDGVTVRGTGHGGGSDDVGFVLLLFGGSVGDDGIGRLAVEL